MEEVFKVKLDGMISLPQIEDAVKKAISSFKGSALSKFNISEFQEQLQTAPAQLIELARALDKTGKSEERLNKLQAKIDEQNKKAEKERQKQMMSAIKLASSSKLMAVGLKAASKGLTVMSKSLKGILNIAKIASFALAGVGAVFGVVTSLVDKAMKVISKSASRAITATPEYRLNRAEFEALSFTEQAMSTDGRLAEVLKSLNNSLNDVNSSAAFATLGTTREKYANMGSGKDALLAFLNDVQGQMVKLPDGSPMKKLIMDKLDEITGGNSTFLRGFLANKNFKGEVDPGMLDQLSSTFNEFIKTFKTVNFKEQTKQSIAYNKAVASIGLAFQRVATALAPAIGKLYESIAKVLNNPKTVETFNRWMNSIQKWVENIDFDSLFEKIKNFFISVYEIIMKVKEFFGIGEKPKTAEHLLKKAEKEGNVRLGYSPYGALLYAKNQADISKKAHSLSSRKTNVTTAHVTSNNPALGNNANISIHINNDVKSGKTTTTSTIADKSVNASTTVRNK